MVEDLIKKFPLLKDIIELKEVLWLNDDLSKAEIALSELSLSMNSISEAEKRWERFAPLIVKLFPETKLRNGIIESELAEILKMKEVLEEYYGFDLKGRFLLKCDSSLPVAGSIKARGGIYEVLKHAEDLAIDSGMLNPLDDYSIMAEERFKSFFSNYSLAVGSTGNLGLSIGIIGSAIGFKVAVHMSADAKQWKKDLLRSKGVIVIEYASDYSKAVEEGRKQSMTDPMSYFVDDEHSENLFLGYSTAALRLKKQLDSMGIKIDENNPLFVYLPCGVGGAPGGITFGLKHVFKDAVHCFFVEPTHSPCMLIGLLTGENDKVCVQDFGIDNITDADGLAVGRASGFVGSYIKNILSGIYTVDDDELYKLLAMLRDSENIKIEPSATPGLLGPLRILDSDYVENLKQNKIDEAKITHIAWATGGLFVPAEMMAEFYSEGKKILKEIE